MGSMPQRDTFVIMGLRRKRARLAGEVDATERKLAKQRAELAQVDAVIRLFEPHTNPELIPAIRPTPRGLFFRHGEQVRLCLSALRKAGKPLRAAAVTEYAMLAKGLPVEDRHARAEIAEQIRTALYRLEKRGVVRRIIRAPEAWWELATDQHNQKE